MRRPTSSALLWLAVATTAVATEPQGLANPTIVNLATYAAPYDYGYRNVYEPEPLLDVHATRSEFAPPSR